MAKFSQDTDAFRRRRSNELRAETSTHGNCKLCVEPSRGTVNVGCPISPSGFGIQTSTLYAEVDYSGGTTGHLDDPAPSSLADRSVLNDSTYTPANYYKGTVLLTRVSQELSGGTVDCFNMMSPYRDRPFNNLDDLKIWGKTRIDSFPVDWRDDVANEAEYLRFVNGGVQFTINILTRSLPSGNRVDVIRRNYFASLQREMVDTGTTAQPLYSGSPIPRYAIGGLLPDLGLSRLQDNEWFPVYDLLDSSSGGSGLSSNLIDSTIETSGYPRTTPFLYDAVPPILYVRLSGHTF